METVKTDNRFNESTGGYIVMKFDRSTLDMSGSIRCELETDTGIILKSNELDIFDIKE